MDTKTKGKSITLEEVKIFLMSGDNYIILTHANPDGDTLGSGFALAMILDRIGKRATVICPDKIPQKYSYFTGFSKQNAVRMNSKIIAVDIADTQLMGSLRDEYSNKVDLCIDHHISNTFYAKQTYLDDDAAANCECIYDLANIMNIDIDKPLALAMYTGISTDTGCFKFSNTTPKTLRIAANLMECEIDIAEINRIMFETKSRIRIELETMALNGMEFYFDDKCAIITITRKMYEKTGCLDEDLEGITAIPRSVEGVIVGITLREKNDGSLKASVRTYPPVDASEICKNLGGGGHIRAAGCQFDSSYTTKKAKEEILKYVEKALGGNSAGTDTDK